MRRLLLLLVVLPLVGLSVPASSLAAKPEISFSPHRISYGQVALDGLSSYVTVTFTNKTASSSFTLYSFGTGNGFNYEYANDGCGTIGPGDSCSIDLAVYGAVTGRISSDWDFAWTGGDGPEVFVPFSMRVS